MAIEIYDGKILLNSGKIAVDAACCCGTDPNEPPDPEPDPWPDDLPAWCRCYLSGIPATGSLTISGIPNNMDNYSCGKPCVPPLFLARYVCNYSAMNGNYTCTLYDNAPLGVYGECLLGAVADDSNPGTLIESRYDCFGGAKYSEKYLWKVSLWYNPCYACNDAFGGLDITRVRTQISVALHYQEWFGTVTAGCTPATCTFNGGSVFLEGTCYDTCRHIGLCHGSSCTMNTGTFTWDVSVTI